MSHVTEDNYIYNQITYILVIRKNMSHLFFFISDLWYKIYLAILLIYYFSLSFISKACDLPFVDNIGIRITSHPSIILYVFSWNYCDFVNEHIMNFTNKIYIYFKIYINKNYINKNLLAILNYEIE